MEFEFELPKAWKDSLDSTFSKILADFTELLSKRKKRLEQQLLRALSHYKSKPSSYQSTSKIDHEQSSQQITNYVNEKLSEKFELLFHKADLYMTDISDSILECFKNISTTVPNSNSFSPQRLRHLTSLESKHCGLKSCFEIIPNRNLVCLGELRGNISIWSANTFKKINSSKSFNTEISFLKYIPERDILYASSKNKVKAMRIRKDGAMMILRSLEIPCNLGFMYPSHDLQVLITSEGIRSTSIRDLTTFKLKGEIKKSGHSVFPIRKYGYIVIDYFDGLIGLCDMKRAKEVSRVETGHRFSHVISWGFCERENLLVAALSSGKMKIWNLNGEGLFYLDERSIPRINSLDLVNGGRSILFTKEDNYIWGYDREEKEVMTVAHLQGVVKDFKIFGKKKLLFAEHCQNKIDVYLYLN